MSSPIKHAAVTTTTILQFAPPQQQQQQQQANAGAAAAAPGAPAADAAAGAAPAAAGGAAAGAPQQQQQGQQLHLTRRYETPDVTFEAQEVDWSPLSGMRCLNQFMLKGHANQVRSRIREDGLAASDCLGILPTPCFSTSLQAVTLFCQHWFAPFPFLAPFLGVKILLMLHIGRSPPPGMHLANVPPQMPAAEDLGQWHADPAMSHRLTPPPPLRTHHTCI